MVELVPIRSYVVPMSKVRMPVYVTEKIKAMTKGHAEEMGLSQSDLVERALREMFLRWKREERK